MAIEVSSDGRQVVAGEMVLELEPDGRYLRVRDGGGRDWARLALDASLHTVGALDETTRRADRRIEVGDDVWTMTVELGSAAWRRKVLRVEARRDRLEMTVEVEGSATLTDVDLLGGWSSAVPRAGSGFHASGASFRSLFSPGPSAPSPLVRSSAEPAVLDVSAGGGPGRGNWFFTPPPTCFAVSRSAPLPDGLVPRGPWMVIGVSAPIAGATFGSVRYEPGERSFSIRLEYEGQTRVDGTFRTPPLVLLTGAADPYGAVRAWADDLRARRAAPATPTPADRPAWWLEPIFCGWGAQSALVRERGGSPADHATQAEYDRFLETLGSNGVVPGTIVIDDRWQRTYGLADPDAARWPDLPAWIAARHRHEQRVLLWWKCWDPEGIAPELCVRNKAGVPVTVDPSNRAYEALLRGEVRRMLRDPDAGGLGADGLKVDFSGLTPSGSGLRREGSEWGVSLLHRLLSILHDEAHRTRPDALVITHAPHPGFADVTDMVRLNDMLRLNEPDDDRSAVVGQMRHRAAIVAASLPSMPIDTDDWCAPNLATWREYLAAKSELGVPSLYYVDTLDLTGEGLEPRDYAAIREDWAAYRARVGLPARPQTYAGDPVGARA